MFLLKHVLRLILFVTILSFQGCHQRPTESHQTQKEPNIIFLLTDDHRWDALSSMGNSILKTPALDSLALGGLHFTNAYVTTSICAVSRASILTGQYESRHGIHDFKKGLDNEALEKTYPLLLKQHGYRIGFIGKYGVGEAAVHPREKFDFWECVEQDQPDYENVDEQGNYIHYTDVISNHITQFLNETEKEPFCLSVSFKAPHVQDGDARQFIPNPRYLDHFKDVEIPLPKTSDPSYWEYFPDFFRTDENIARERWKPRFATSERYQKSAKDYYRLLTGVDDAVKRLRNELKQKGLDENTVIIFMGDNGMFLGEHGLAGKWYPYEESVRVPLIIYDPRKPDLSRRIEHIALNIDIAPTILGLAGLETDGGMQGVDLIDVAKNDRPARIDFFYEHSFFGSPKLPVSEAVISPDLKYIIYPEHGFEELYDLTEDPLEEKNLIKDERYQDVVVHQRERYKELKKEAK